MNSQSSFAQSLGGLGKIIAIAAAIFLTPSLHDLTFEYALAFFEGAYGYGHSQLAGWGWMTICGLGIYFSIQAFISVLITFLIMKLAGH